jgi:hypothetical protein
VAPSGNQTATEKTNINLKRSENPVYSPFSQLRAFGLLTFFEFAAVQIRVLYGFPRTGAADLATSWF